MLQTNSTRKTGRQSLKGFSLVELLVVMTIISLLMGLTIGVSGAIQRKAAESKVRAQLADLMQEIELYKSDEGRYPPSSGSRLVLRKNAANPGDPKGFMDWYEDRYPGTIFTIMDIVGTGTASYFVDPWGKEIRYEYNTSAEFIYLIGSFGPDSQIGARGSGSFGEGDDITNRNGSL